MKWNTSWQPAKFYSNMKLQRGKKFGRKSSQPLHSIIRYSVELCVLYKIGMASKNCISSASLLNVIIFYILFLTLWIDQEIFIGLHVFWFVEIIMSQLYLIIAWDPSKNGINITLWGESRDKTPMTKRQHLKPQYKKCSPQPQNPNPQTQKSVAFHT